MYNSVSQLLLYVFPLFDITPLLKYIHTSKFSTCWLRQATTEVWAITTKPVFIWLFTIKYADLKLTLRLKTVCACACTKIVSSISLKTNWSQTTRDLEPNSHFAYRKWKQLLHCWSQAAYMPQVKQQPLDIPLVLSIRTCIYVHM